MLLFHHKVHILTGFHPLLLLRLAVPLLLILRRGHTACPELSCDDWVGENPVVCLKDGNIDMTYCEFIKDVICGPVVSNALDIK